jgi:FkbM family methyltransferase
VVVIPNGTTFKTFFLISLITFTVKPMATSLQRLSLISNRFIKAASMGVWFPGTSHFQLPTQFRVGDRTIHLNAPPEEGLAYDFINVLLDDEYGLRLLKNPPKTILDIGANIGLFSLWAASCFPNATIHAYEPNPRVVPFTQKNLQPINAHLFAEAVGAQAGFAILEDEGESRLGLLTTGAIEGIPVIAFQQAIERLGGTIDLLKLDCEGAEWEIFDDPRPFQQVHNIRMEYHLTGNRTLADLKAAVASIGFTFEHLEENIGFGIAWLSRRSPERI